MKKTQRGRYTILKQNRNNLIKLLYHLHKIDRMVILFFSFFHFVVYNDSITVKMYITYISAYTTIYSSYTRQRRHHDETYRAQVPRQPCPLPAGERRRCRRRLFPRWEGTDRCYRWRDPRLVAAALPGGACC